MTNHIEPPVQESVTPKQKSTMGLGFSILFIVVILLIGIGIAAQYYIADKFSHLAQAQKNNALLIQKNQQNVEQQIGQLENTVKAQDQIVNALRQTQSGYNRDDWKTLEAEFLVKLANDKLQLDSNVPQAITLLQSADQVIRDMPDTHLFPVRKAIAADIATLQAVPVLDMAGVYLRLVAINDQLGKLSIATKPATPALAETPSEIKQMPWWKEGLQKTWQALRQIVIVRYNQQGVAPLMTPEQQDFIYQNLHAALEKAMWGLLHRQPDIYRDSLQQAINWINRYFVTNIPATQNVLTDLAQLQQIDVHPAVPQNLESLQTFRDYFAARDVQVESQPVATKQ